MLRSPPETRRLHTAAYLAFTTAGATAVAFPSPSIESTAGSRLLVVCWVVFLIAGGLLSAGGRLLGRWPGEFAGIPLLAFAFLIYAVATIYSTIVSGRYTGITAGVALGAILFLVSARWFEVNQIRREALNRAVTESRVARGVPANTATEPAALIRSHRERAEDDGGEP